MTIKALSKIEISDDSIAGYSSTNVDGPLVFLSSFLRTVNGTQVDDESALIQALAAASHGRLVVDISRPLVLTQTLYVSEPVTVISLSPCRSVTTSIVASFSGDMIVVTASNVNFVGLGFEDRSRTGSTIKLLGSNSKLVNCDLANTSGSLAPMIMASGSGTRLVNDYFSNFSANAYCWAFTAVSVDNTNSAVVGGWAYGPGKGGLLYDNVESRHKVNDLHIDDWDCITTGSSQIDDRSAAALDINGGVYDQSSDTGVLIASASSGSSVTIKAAYISTAQNSTGGRAIYLQSENSANTATLNVIGNFITETRVGIELGGVPSSLNIVGNYVEVPATPVLVQSGHLSGVIAANRLGNSTNHPSPPLPYDSGRIASLANGGTQAIGDAVSTLNLLDGITLLYAGNRQDDALEIDSNLSSVFVQSGYSEGSDVVYISAFRQTQDGQMINDDDAFKIAVNWCLAHRKTLVIDHDTVLNLKYTIVITSSLTIIGDGTSTIYSCATGTAIDIQSATPVLIQGLHVVQNAASGAVILMGGNRTTVASCSIENMFGNHDVMVQFGGPNQLLKDTNFTNNDESAYCWSANYIDDTSHLDIGSQVVGGSALGIGNGGLIGNGSDRGRVEGFRIAGWKSYLTGSYGINARDVLSLQIVGGEYVGATEAAINLGGGKLGCLSVTLENLSIQGRYGSSTGIKTLTDGGVGVNDLSIFDTDVQNVEVGISLGLFTGNSNILGSTISGIQTALNVVSSAGALNVIDNDLSGPTAISVSDRQAGWAKITLAGNKISGALNASLIVPSNLLLAANSGIENAVFAQPNAPSISTAAWLTVANGKFLVATGTLTITGSAGANVTITAFEITGSGRVVLGSTASDRNGNWTLTSVSMTEGSHLLSAVAQDSSGNVSIAGKAVSLFVASSSRLFDTSYYMAQYGILVNASGLEPYQHYLRIGAAERLNPNAWFDTAYYLKQHPDVAASGVNPLLQYEDEGWLDGRATSLLFSGAAYWAANPNVSGVDPLEDWLLSGAATSGLDKYALGQGGTADKLVHAEYLFPQLGATLWPAAAAAAASSIYKAGAWRSLVNPNSEFDTKFYMATHRAEVLASGLDPLTHYETIGWREGYDPSLVFSTAAYLTIHPAAASSGVDPLTASLTMPVDPLFAHATAGAGSLSTTAVTKAGIVDPLLDTDSVARQIATLLPLNGADPAAVAKAYNEGAWRSVTQPNALFDSNYYLARNQDVAAAGIDPLAHYGAFGAREGRDPDPLFDSSFYLQRNSDVARAGVNPLLHFETFGWREGRNPDALFDVKYYLAQNPDVAAAKVNPLVHFEAFGWREGRNPDALFDVKYYLTHNPDVAAAKIDPLVHYDQYGWKEGRNPSAAFATSTYLSANPDVSAAGVDPLAHYLASGIGQGRAIYSV